MSRVQDYLPDVLRGLPCTGTEEFYRPSDLCKIHRVFLRYGTVKSFRPYAWSWPGRGLTLKIWDSFRPMSAQFRLWEVCPDDTYVANPNQASAPTAETPWT